MVIVFPRFDFVEKHRLLAQPGFCVVGIGFYCQKGMTEGWLNGKDLAVFSLIGLKAGWVFYHRYRSS